MNCIKNIKQGLREGKYMGRASLGLAALAFVLYLWMPYDAIKIVFVLSSIITAAISGVVFSLRDKAVQYGLSLIGESRAPEKRAEQIKQCTEKLTTMLIWGLLCSLMCVIASYLQPDPKTQMVDIGCLKYYNAICCALFVFCYVKYFYLIFAFEDFEFIRIKHAVENRKRYLRMESIREREEDKKKFQDTI